MPAASVSPPRAGRSSAQRSKAQRASKRRTAPKQAKRVRWDRLGRLAIVSVIAVLLYLYVSGGVHLLSTWKEAHADRGAVAALAHEHRALVQEHESLGRQGTIEGEARRLGMMKKGEQQYIITGLPRN